MLKDRLERRVATLSAGGKSRPEQVPLGAEGQAFLLEWITGKADDGALVSRAKSTQDGLSLIERACAARPANARAWAARAELCIDAGYAGDAADHAQRAHALAPLDPQVGLAALRVLVAAGRPEEALAVIPAVLENARRTSSHAVRQEASGIWQALAPGAIEPLLESARTRIAAGELETAATAFEALRAQFGPRADVLLPLAAVCQDLGRLGDAARVYGAAAEAEPANVDALSMAGIAARDVHDVDTADRLLSRAFVLDPGSSFAQYNLGRLRFDQGRIDEAAGLALGARAVTRGAPWAVQDIAAKLAVHVERNDADPDWATARFKIDHDLEQFGYLRDHTAVGAALDPVIHEYVAALRDPNLPTDAYSMVALHPGTYPMFSRTYKAPLYAPDPEPPQGPLVNPALDWQAIESQYLDGSPALAVVDDLLAPAALAALRAFCLESTIWNELKGGYLGAYMPDGFSGRLLLSIADELRATMPRVIRDHPLQGMWAYKYDSRHPGMGVHADAGAVNINFWLTPDEANLDPASGGLAVYTPQHALDRRLAHLDAGHEAIHAGLAAAGAKRQSIPYRANRAVIFDAGLFHESDAFRFRAGYVNRRVSVTLLFGTPKALDAGK